MHNWCKDCARKEDGYMHIKCNNCVWNIGNENDPFKWDRFVSSKENARHPSSYFAPVPKKSKKSGFWDFIVSFTKIFI